MVLFILSKIANKIFIHKVDKHLIDVELECKKQERRENILTLNSSNYLLNESNLIELPFYSCSVFIQSLLFSCRLFLCSLSLQSWVFSQWEYIQSFFSINLKYSLEEIAKQGFFFLILEYIFLFDIFNQFVSSLALVVDIIQDVDS